MNEVSAPRVTSRDIATDAALALALALIVVAASLPFFRNRALTPEAAVAIGLAAVHTLSLAARRVAPVATLAVNLASGIAFAITGYPLVMLGIAVPVATYTVASRRPPPVAAPALAGSVLALLVATAATPASPDLSTTAGNLVVVAAAWYFGATVFARRRYLLQLERRTRELEEAREELARAAVAEERLRIAREIHDVIAHSLSMIAVQAGVGAHVIDERPGEAKRSLRVIEEASKSALGEIRAVLGGLRRDGDDDLSPAPSLADLDALVAGARDAGVDVTVEVRGARRKLPPGIERACYRVVQEAITNVIKHARSPEAHVTIVFTPGEVELAIRDRGLGPRSPSPPGHGIRGMRERVAVYGGTLTATAGEDGGFVVHARIPTEARA